MLDIRQAKAAALRALAQVWPHKTFVLTPMRNPEKRYPTWVFHCKVRGENRSCIAKLSSPDAAGRAKIQNQFARLKTVKANMGKSKLTVPEAIFFAEQDAAMIMQAVRGDSLRQLMPEFTVPQDASAYLENAARWLSAFHATTSKPAFFDPAPHMNWLTRKVQRHAAGAIAIPQYESFMQAYEQLEHLANQCSGLPSVRCVTHRDFHLGNLIFAPKGAIYGIDFENQKDDVALRDVVSYLFDFIFRWQGCPASFANFQQAATLLHKSADGRTAPFPGQTYPTTFVTGIPRAV